MTLFFEADIGKTLLNALGEAVIATDPDGSVLFWNAAAAQLYGYSDSDANGRSIYELTVPDLGDVQAREIMQTLGAGQSWSGEFHVRDRSGRVFLAEVTDVPVLSSEGKLEMIIGLSRDITQRKEIELEREHLIQRMDAAALVKDNFLTLVSHELRTPLTTILGMSSVLIRHGHLLDDESSREALLDIANSSHRMTRLVEDLLSLARTTSSLPVSLEPLSPERCVRSAVSEHERHSPSRRIMTGGLHACAPALGHRLLLEHVLMNLLSNADKYSPVDLAIEVSCKESSGEVIVSVLDAGVGISAEDMPHVFEEFYRASATNHLPGAGLGLAVCRRLMELQGGRVWLEPRAGGGTVASVALPKAI